ncbi:MAG TPA: aminoglycoside phosphotransferase family protein [Longimicrobiaceae bacterium]|nr:aminoglycoside phosphotransferase family protein [Longimicrobiaceae bacterium]
MTTEPRIQPLVYLSWPTTEAMVRPVFGIERLTTIERIDGGLVNTMLRLTSKTGASVVLRVYAGDGAGFDLERRLLPRLAESLPVPEVQFAADGEEYGTPPYLVYWWIDGITLNECRRRHPPALETLAEPLGRLLAGIGAFAPLDGLRRVRIPARLAEADERLRDGLARTRLGAVPADRLRDLLAASRPELETLDDAVLMHGDFGGRNLLVRESGNGGWEIAGVVDWETAGAGSALWDVGSLFRYPHRYSAEFRDAFARGYRAAGGELPRGWWRLARLLDSTRQVATLAKAGELPTVFAECRELVEAIVHAEPGKERDGA